MKANLRWAAALLAVLGSAPALACFTVYDRNNNVVYNAQVPPVDMSRPLHETMPSAYPGGQLVFGNDTACPATNTAGRTKLASPSGKAPLLTDASTAQSMGLKHTMIRDNVALVPETPDSMQSGVMIAESPVSNANDTRAMGAGPAPRGANDTRSMGAGPAPKAAKRPATVITEMHNPPLTAEQKR